MPRWILPAARWPAIFTTRYTVKIQEHLKPMLLAPSHGIIQMLETRAKIWIALRWSSDNPITERNPHSIEAKLSNSFDVLLRDERFTVRLHLPESTLVAQFLPHGIHKMPLAGAT